ncbi:MAG: response regulator [Deltaproteobacteria bacterium]|nr:response regulator [Deltaproteobacteria bacterium]
MSERTFRILVVDDEIGMREGCRRILTAEGYEVETAPDGEKALAVFAEKGPFEAALVDLQMPRVGGMELIERIHAVDEDVVLLVITAYATIDTAVDATKRGAYGYIPKPFTPDELLMHVKNGLEKRALSMEAKQLREERERRLLEVAFERSKSNTILNCMTDGVLVVNRGKQIVLRNAALARIIPSCADHPLPSPFDCSLDNEEFKKLISEVVDETKGLLIASRELVLGKCTYMVNAAPVIEPNGESLGAVVVLRDITALKKLEVAKSMFISMVAHEVKSPLAAIESFLGMALTGANGDGPKTHELLEKALVRANTLRTLVSDLLNLTAIETGNFSLKRSSIDICKVVEDAAEAFAEKAHDKGISLSVECKEQLVGEQVLADRNAIYSVVSNLIDNAIKYTPSGGSVQVRLENHGLYARVSVKDSGIGLDAEQRDKVFDEFFRVKNEHTAGIPGTGLGLTLVKRLVEMHNGRIDVESAVGKGSAFSISLPTADSAEMR